MDPDENGNDVTIEETPRPGTLAWLLEQPRVNVQGFELPACHRIPDDATILLGDPDGKCRIVKADGTRCKSPSLRALPACLVHAGGGGFTADGARAMSKRAHAIKLARRERRELLGIGPRRAASARQIARIQAIERAEQLATAIVSAPLDDPNLSTIERQRAALAALDATFPLAQVSAELSIPADGETASAMGWQEMRQLAAQLLDESS